MTIWDTAGAAIDAAFSDPEPIVYTGAGLAGQPIQAIRADDAAPSFEGVGATQRTVTYEVAQGDFTTEPRKPDSFIHRGHVWHVQNTTRRDDVGKYQLVVSQGAPL